MPNNALKAEILLAAAVDIADPQEREAYLKQGCGGDASLLAELRSMVSDFFSADSLLKQPCLSLTRAAEEPPHTAGEQIGPYRLLEEIGSGGMGMVYMAEQKVPLRRLVALKVIKPGMDSHKVIARFEAERQALALMNHPNIAKVLDAGTTSTGLPYFVMELVKGVPITEYCDQQRLNNRQRLQLFVTVCHAVAHAHQKGVIHRDLKPSNVLVEVHDVTPMPKVIDFGIAKAIGQQLTDKTLYTGFCEMVGTPLYMSPEQAGQSSVDVDTRSDVYSLGVLLYELLTGTTPFEKETFAKAAYEEIRRMIREDEPLRPSARVSTLEPQTRSTISDRRQLEHGKLSAHLRGELDWIVMNALEKDRARRYESASAFAADVQRYLNGDPIEASPPSLTYRASKFARRHMLPLSVATVVILSLATATAISLWQADKATQAKRTADRHFVELKQAFKSLDKEKENADISYQTARSAVQQLLTRVADQRLGAIAELKDVRRQLLSDASAFYNRLIRLRPKDATIYLERGEIYSLLGDFASARTDYEQALVLASDSSLAHKTLGTFLVFCPDISVRGDAYEGLKHVQRATELEPQNAQFQYDLYSILSVLGRREEASFALGKAVELDPSSTVFHAHEARSTGDLAKATALIRTAIRESPTEVHLYYLALELLILQGDEQEVTYICTQAINFKPHDPVIRPFYVQRAEIYERTGDYDAALKDYSKAIEIAPYAAATYKHRGRLHITCERYSSWLDDLAASIDLNPDDVDGLYELPYLPRYTSDPKLFERAWRILDNALERSADRSSVLLQRARMHAVGGMFDKAFEDFRASQRLAAEQNRRPAFIITFYCENASQLAARKLWDEAIADAVSHFDTETVDYWRVRNSGELAWILATSSDANVRRPDKAIVIAKIAMQGKREVLPQFSVFNRVNPAFSLNDIGTLDAPGVSHALAALGWLAWQDGRKSEAKELFAEATTPESAHPRFAYLYALFCADENNASGIRRLSDRAFCLLSDDPLYRMPERTLFALRTCCLIPDALSDYRPLITIAKQLAALRPADSKVALVLTKVYLRAGQFHLAREALDRAEALAKSDGDSTPYLSYLRALILHKLDDQDGARSAFVLASNDRDSVGQLPWDEMLTIRIMDDECRKCGLGQ